MAWEDALPRQEVRRLYNRAISAHKGTHDQNRRIALAIRRPTTDVDKLVAMISLSWRYELDAADAYRRLLDQCADSVDVLQHYHLFLKACHGRRDRHATATRPARPPHCRH